MNKINHINNEIDYLTTNSMGLTHDEFIKDETLKRAFVRSMEIIGEAVKTIPKQIFEKKIGCLRGYGHQCAHRRSSGGQHRL